MAEFENEVPFATNEDLQAIQGWAPVIVVDGQNENGKPSTFRIIHGNGYAVETTGDQFDKYGSIRVQTPDGQIVETFVAYLWKLHGEPCQRVSKSLGGQGYKKLF